MQCQHNITGDSRIRDFKNLEESFTEHIEKRNVNSSCALALLYNDRGHSKYMQVEFDSAIDDYNKAIEINPNLGVAYYNRATVLYRLGDFEAAYKDMIKAVDMEPNNIEFQNGLEACKQNVKEHAN
ncbi:hypothetical protein R5R35_013154 [Gryllus longicercus]|uniref:Tetratricopeptide repeat protein n=1 Tax=Gryllus longicercus TaxID=2509291 RepID=A0AAN9Z3I1_9ORTH